MDITCAPSAAMVEPLLLRRGAEHAQQFMWQFGCEKFDPKQRGKGSYRARRKNDPRPTFFQASAMSPMALSTPGMSARRHTDQAFTDLTKCTLASTGMPATSDLRKSLRTSALISEAGTGLPK
jgi:hypothetical protein